MRLPFPTEISNRNANFSSSLTDEIESRLAWNLLLRRYPDKWFHQFRQHFIFDPIAMNLSLDVERQLHDSDRSLEVLRIQKDHFRTVFLESEVRDVPVAVNRNIPRMRRDKWIAHDPVEHTVRLRGTVPSTTRSPTSPSNRHGFAEPAKSLATGHFDLRTPSDALSTFRDPLAAGSTAG
jgi:hypothetical protein